MMISRKLISNDLKQQYNEKVEDILVKNGFLIDYSRDLIFKENKDLMGRYSEVVNWDLSAIDKFIFLINNDFCIPNQDGLSGNGLVSIDFEKFMQLGDIDAVKEDIDNCIKQIKDGAMSPNVEDNAGVGRWKEQS